MADPLEFNDLFWEEFSAEENLTLFSSEPAALGVTGKGTIAVRSKATQKLNFIVSAGDGYPKLSLKITQTSCEFAKEDGSGKTTLEIQHVRPEANPHLPKMAMADGTVYWLSIDRSNWILRYGKYYSCKALTILGVSLTKKTGDWLEKLTTVEVTDEMSVGYYHRSTS